MQRHITSLSGMPKIDVSPLCVCTVFVVWYQLTPMPPLTAGRYPNHAVSKRLEASERHMREIRKLRTNDGDYYHGFHSGVLASARLFKDHADILHVNEHGVSLLEMTKIGNSYQTRLTNELSFPGIQWGTHDSGRKTFGEDWAKQQRLSARQRWRGTSSLIIRNPRLRTDGPSKSRRTATLSLSILIQTPSRPSNNTACTTNYIILWSLSFWYLETKWYLEN